PWVILAQAGHCKAKLRNRAGLEVLYEYVGVRQHRFEQCPVFSFAEVEHDRLLAAIEPDKIGALTVNDVIVVAREIAFRPLDLDHARAGIGETARALRRRDSLLDRNDKKAIERRRHLNTT